VVSQLAHLGQLILAGGSYATLRDLADYGATLCFDDAETLASRSDGDSDKRSLLLAGNRRGAVVTVKEPGPDKTWVTRYVNAFCPRLFSATQLPDEILASRTIIVPLIRTLDRRRANIDPADPEVWPVDRDALNDRLWAFALKALPKIGEYERSVGSLATLQGRSLQPWRGILAVAAWLDTEAGITGLMNDIDKISVAYQKERAQLETNDLTSVAVHALVECATSATSSTTATNKEMFYSTQFIANACVQVVQDQEVPIDVEDITPDKVGRVLAKMRFKRDREDGRGLRGWIVKYADIIRWCERYGIDVPPELVTLSVSGVSGDSGEVAQKTLV
jgi:hypothetical protein